MISKRARVVLFGSFMIAISIFSFFHVIIPEYIFFFNNLERAF